MKHKSKLIRISRRIFQVLAYVIAPIAIFVLVGWVVGVIYIIALLGLDFIVGAYAFAYEKGKLNDVN